MQFSLDVTVLIIVIAGTMLLPLEVFAPPPAPTCDGQTATIYVDSGTIVGGPDNTQPFAGTLNGFTGADVMVGTDGPDTINGDAGDDRICGRADNDKINGQDGNDRLFGEGGNDELDGGPGSDYMNGGSGKDTCRDISTTTGGNISVVRNKSVNCEKSIIKSSQTN
jgi:Ca2+-binding RTX toxin-like protein